MSLLAPGLLEVDKLTVAFPGHVAVREASFAIAPAETLALVGDGLNEILNPRSDP